MEDSVCSSWLLYGVVKGRVVQSAASCLAPLQQQTRAACRMLHALLDDLLAIQGERPLQSSHEKKQFFCTRHFASGLILLKLEA